MFQQVLLRIRNTTNLGLWKNLRETYLSLWKNLRETYLSLWKKKKITPSSNEPRKSKKPHMIFIIFEIMWIVWKYHYKSLALKMLFDKIYVEWEGLDSWLLREKGIQTTNHTLNSITSWATPSFFFQCRSSFGHVIYVISICKFCVIMLNSLWLNIVNVAARFSDKCKNASNSGNKEINFTYKMHLMCKNMMLYIVHITYNHSHEVAIIVAPLFFFHFFFSNSLFYWIF